MSFPIRTAIAMDNCINYLLKFFLIRFYVSEYGVQPTEISYMKSIRGKLG